MPPTEWGPDRLGLPSWLVQCLRRAGSEPRPPLHEAEALLMADGARSQHPQRTGIAPASVLPRSLHRPVG